MMGILRLATTATSRSSPETPHEIDLALKAVRANCCGSYRYAGPDPEVKAKLREQGDMDAIDSP